MAEFSEFIFFFFLNLQGVDDSFMTLPTLTESDNDWFNSIFDDQGLVYNDKNLGETATQPCIKSEHSYSANNVNRSSPLNFVKMDGLYNCTDKLIERKKTATVKLLLYSFIFEQLF